MSEGERSGARRVVALSSAVLDVVQRVLVGAVVLILSISALLLLWQVFDRLVLGGGQNWIDEYARLSLVWLTFLGAAALLREGKNLAVEYFVDRAPDGIRRGIHIGVGVLVLALMVVLLLQIPSVWRSSAALVSPSLGIPRTALASAAVVSFAISAVYCIESIARTALRMPPVRTFATTEYAENDAV